MTDGRVRIGSAIFNADHGHLADAVVELDRAGIDFIHWDVFDGHFIPDLGFPPRTLQAVRPLTRVPFEVHLAVTDLRALIQPLAKAGANLVFVPVESTPLLFEGVTLVREEGMKAGVSLAVGTPVSAIVEVLPHVDAVLLLSRVYGETVSKVRFMPQTLRKVEALREISSREGLTLDIQVVGGLSIESTGCGERRRDVGGLWRRAAQSS